MKAAILGILLFFLPLTAAAQDSSLPNPPDVELVPMKKGELAPFAGVLLPPVAIASLVAELQQFGERLTLEVEKAKRDAAAELAYEKERAAAAAKADATVATARIDALLKNNSVLVKENEKLEKGKKSVLVWTFVGVAAGAVVMGAAVFALDRAIQ